MPAFALCAVLLMTCAQTSREVGAEAKATPRQSESASKAETLFKEALSLSDAGDTVLARDRLSEAIKLWAQAGEHEKAARSSLLMGDSHKRMTRFQEALYYYNQALKKPLSHQLRAIAFNSIASLYAEVNHTELARRHYEKGAAHARLAGDVSAQTAALSGLAALHYQTGEIKQSLALIEQARQANYQQGNEEVEAALLHLSGRIAQKQGSINSAQEALNKALAIYQRTGNEPERGRVLVSISELCLSSGQNRLAFDRAQQAVELAESQARQAISMANKLRVRDLRWQVHLSLARAQCATGQKGMAVKSYYRVVSHIEAIRLSLRMTDIGTVAFGEKRQAPYRELMDLLMEQGKIDEGYLLAEHARSRAILELIEARLRGGLAKLADEDGKLGELSRSIAGLRTQLLSAKISLKQRANIEREIEEHEFALEEARVSAELEHSAGRYAWFRPVSIEQVQKNIGAGKECVLEFSLGDKRSFAWLITPGEVFTEILPGRQEIEKQTEAYLAALSNRPNHLYIERQVGRHKELAAALFAKLFGRLSERIAPLKRLIVVPDGVLHYLPFETLNRDGRYLLEDHEISYLPSAGLLTLLRTSKSDAEAEDKLELLAFGDPVFEVKSSGRKRAANGGDEAERRLRASYGSRLAQLPRTNDEVREIAGLFAQARRRVYIGKESTEEAVKAEPLSRYRRLHFATHGLIDEKNPYRSAIVMALDSDPREDGFLEMGEIAELNLDCDLVVLSACQSGRGRLFSSEGVVGLIRAFIYAGARSVVASLWNVSDISTSRLMKDFYHHLIAGSGHAAALREAKLQMLRSGNETRHPYYWAPFIAVGKP